MSDESCSGVPHASTRICILFALSTTLGCYAPSEADFKPYGGKTVPSASDEEDDVDDDADDDSAIDDTAIDDVRATPRATDAGARDAATRDAGAAAARDAGSVRTSDAGRAPPAVTAPDAGRTEPEPAPPPEEPAPPAPSAPAPTKLSFSVLTVTMRGTYAPRNVGAIWIETASGTHVKTLAKWAGIRQRHLTAFVAASGGNAVDAVTAATLRTHTTHSVTWNLKDKAGQTAPDGAYRVRVEMTESTRGNALGTIPFTKGATPVQLTAPDQAGLSAMTLSLE